LSQLQMTTKEVLGRRRTTYWSAATWHYNRRHKHAQGRV